MKSENKNLGIGSRFLLMMFSLLIAMSSVNAVYVLTASDELIGNFAIADDLNAEDLVFKSGFIPIYPDGDVNQFYYTLTSKPVYLEFTALNNNASIQIFDSGNNLIKNVTLDLIAPLDIDRHLVKVSPEFAGDSFFLRINNPVNNSLIFTGAYVINDNDRETSLLVLISPFTNAITELILINISIWRLGFFIFIILVPLAFLTLLVWAIFKAIEWAKHLNEIKNEVIYDKRNNRGR